MSPLLLAFAVSVAAPGFEDLDAGPSSDAVADIAWVGDGKAQAVWFTAKRDLSFRMDRRRGADLWTNQLQPDGGLQRPHGEILCPTSPTEFFSSPRIASNRAQTWVAWKVTTAGRDVLRASSLDVLGRANCGVTVYDPGAGGRFTGLQLEESAGTFMALLETPTQILAIPLNGTAGSAALLVTKVAVGAGSSNYEPSLGAKLGGGFTVAWSEFGELQVIDIDARAVVQNAYVSPWSGVTLNTPPLVVGPPVRLAAMGRSVNDMAPTLKVGPVLTTPVDGPLNFTKLVASVEGTSTIDPLQARVRVFGKALQTWTLTDFTPTGSNSALLPQSVTPLAAAGAFDRTAAFMDFGGEYGVATYTGPSLSGNNQSQTIKSDTSQLLPSVVWVDGGVFAVSFMQGTTLQAGVVNPAVPAVISNVNVWSNDGGVYRFHPRASGPGLAVSVQTGSSSTLALTTFAQGQLTSATPFMTVTAPGFDEAVVGEHGALFWARGGSAFASGQGLGLTPITNPGVQLGRCGAKVSDQLLVPYVNGGDLKIISLLDQPFETWVSRVVRSDALGVEPPCLAAYGREVLIVANDDTGALRAWKTSIDDVLANRAALEVSGLPPRPNAHGVKNPVVIGTAAGWQLAWEATDAYGNQIYEGTIPFDGGVPQASMVSTLIDDRAPLLAASPAGEVIVVWQQFIENIGAVVVRSRRVDRIASVPDGGIGDAGLPLDAGVNTDGGVIIIDDGGIVLDGGVAIDAGTPDAGSDGGAALDGGSDDAGIPDAGFAPDGGVTPQPLSFSACGCGPSGDPALALFGALLFFSARRRRLGSPE